MKVSQLIQALQKAQEAYGDIDVVHASYSNRNDREEHDVFDDVIVSIGDQSLLNSSSSLHQKPVIVFVRNDGIYS